MLIQHRKPAPARKTRPTFRFIRTAFLTVIAMSIAACGSGGGNSSKPPAVGTVIVKVTNPAGTPIGGAGVSLNGSVTPSDPLTDAKGEVTFKDAIAGPRVISVSKPCYFQATRNFVAADGSVTNVTLNLVSVTAATPVVLATHPLASSDGKTLTVDVDMAVLDENGTPWQTLTAAEFTAYGAAGNCEAGNCVIDPQKQGSSGYTAQVDGQTFSFVPARSQPATAIAVLLEQSTEMAKFDPTGFRLQAVNDFFDAVSPPDVVTLGSYRGVSNNPILTTYGGFTSDARSLEASVSALAGQEQGDNPLETAIAEMISFVGANPPAGPSSLQRAVVAVMRGVPTFKYGTPETYRAFRDTIFGAGIPVVIVGEDWLFPSEADITSRTGGAFVLAQYPEQLPVVFRSLGAIVGHSIAFNRVRVLLDAGKAGVFVPGSSALLLMSVHVGPQIDIKWIPVSLTL